MPNTPFTIDNLPFGVISTTSNPRLRCATAYVNDAIDLEALERDGFFKEITGFEKTSIFGQKHLNEFAVLSKESRAEVRRRLQKLLRNGLAAASYSTPLEGVTTHLPMDTYNFSDFYCSLEHAENCSKTMKLNVQPNWYSIPSVYCGRTSSLSVSGTPLIRPCGVIQQSTGSAPVYTATSKLDFELEMGVFLSKPLTAGQRLSLDDATEHIFGFVILNDWSARDIQAFEMPPLGPFHSKGFMTSISPWVVTLEALQSSETARTITQVPPPLPHLTWDGPKQSETYDIDLSVDIIRNEKRYQVTSTNLKELYWTPHQQLTHLVSAGELLKTGDLFGTGTISSAVSSQFNSISMVLLKTTDSQQRVNSDNEKTGLGCLLERMAPENQLASLTQDNLVFLEDGDEVIMEAWFNGPDGRRLGGFGHCRGRVQAADLSIYK